MFSVYDVKAQAYLQPFFASQKGEAIRSFTDAVNKSDHQFHRHAEDYSLFHVGQFDDNSGLVSPLTAPVPVISALECLKEPQLPFRSPEYIGNGVVVKS